MGREYYHGTYHDKKDMKYLFSDWEKIGRTLKGKFIYLFLDYDGTLTPIADTPHMAVTPRRMRALLFRLANMPNCKIAIVSGRQLNDIKKRIRLKKIVYAGNHGLEISGPKIKFTAHLPAQYKRALQKIKAKLATELSAIKGAIVEDKEFSLGVHYRLVDKKDVARVKNAFYAATLLYEVRNVIVVKTGKMALEIRPQVAWDKGKVVLWLLGRQLFATRNKKTKVLPIYIGDDTTDEDAFGALRNKGMTIYVGKLGKSKARFYLKNPEEVARFLEMILIDIKADT